MLFDSILKLLTLYNNERNLPKEKLSFKFWDSVVLTAADELQRQVFEKQIETKIKANEVPSNVYYHIFSDPPGCKIGCGGATMLAIDSLFKLYGSDLHKMKVLVINAGGYSKRLPSASVLGKIFTPFPFGYPPWHLFDVKLAMYIPFLQRMNPGYFIVGSDTIELYNIDEKLDFNDWNFCKSGFTAIAHPSTLDIGTMHGVYVLDNISNNKSLFRKCLNVLQKPSIGEMESSGAVISTSDAHDGEFVYTDSCFYFDHDVGDKLNKFYTFNKPIECEIDAYGDFLKCCGCPLFENAFKIKNEELKRILLELFSILKTETLNVICLDQSEFLHFGTMREYIDNFSRNSSLYKSLKWQSSVNCFVKEESTSRGTSINSYLTSKIDLGENSIVEFCKFLYPVKIGNNCLINQCQSVTHNKLIEIPNNLFVHTIFLSKQSSILFKPGLPSTGQFVTIIFGINDDIKKSLDENSFIFNNIPINKFLNTFKEDVCLQSLSLWQLKLFPVAGTMDESLVNSLELISDNYSENSVNRTDTIYISAEEAFQCKDTFSALNFRDNLLKEINNSRR